MSRRNLTNLTPGELFRLTPEEAERWRHEAYIEALLRERDACDQKGKTERVKTIDAELARARGALEKLGAAVDAAANRAGQVVDAASEVVKRRSISRR